MAWPNAAAAWIALPVVISGVLAVFLRWARVPGGRHGAACIAGLVAGLLLGPSIFGRAFPGAHQRLFVGGVTERESLERLLARQRADLTAMRAADITLVAIEEALQHHAIERAPLDAKLETARAEFAQPQRWLATGAVALAAFGAAIGALPLTRRAIVRVQDELVIERGKPMLAGIIGALIVAIPPVLIVAGIPALGSAVGGTRPAWAGALGIGVIFSIAVLPAAQRPAAWLASASAAAAACVAGAAAGGSILITAVVLGAAWVGLMLPIGLPSQPRRSARRLASIALWAVIVPMLVCFGAMRADVHELAASWRFWALASLALLFASDGRWFAAWLGWRLVGTPRSAGRWTRAAASLPPGAGASMIGAALALEHAGAVSEYVLLPAAIGAVAIEVTRGLRDWLAGVLDAGDESGRDM